MIINHRIRLNPDLSRRRIYRWFTGEVGQKLGEPEFFAAALQLVEAGRAVARFDDTDRRGEALGHAVAVRAF